MTHAANTTRNRSIPDSFPGVDGELSRPESTARLRIHNPLRVGSLSIVAGFSKTKRVIAGDRCRGQLVQGTSTIAWRLNILRGWRDKEIGMSAEVDKVALRWPTLLRWSDQVSCIGLIV